MIASGKEVSVMPKAAMRRKTGHKGIYYNESTKKYDIKYNYGD